MRNDDGVRGEARGSGLWGTRRGGRGSSEGRNRAVRRGLLVLLVLALAAPLAASAGDHEHGRAWRDSYLAPSLQRAADADAERVRARDRPEPRRRRPRAERARQVRDREHEAGDRRRGCGRDRRRATCRSSPTNPGLVITPDQPVVLDAKPDPKPKNPKGNPHTPRRRSAPARTGPPRSESTSSGRRSRRLQATRPKGAGLDAVDRLRRLGHRLEPRRLRRPGARAARHDVAREQLSRRRQRPRDARRGPGRRLGAESRGRSPDGRDRLARRDGRPGHGAHERRDRGRPVDPQEPSRSTTSGSRTSRSTPRPRPASAGTRSTRRSRSSGSRVSSSWLPPATRARAASRRRWPTRPRTTRS